MCMLRLIFLRFVLFVSIGIFLWSALLIWDEDHSSLSDQVLSSAHFPALLTAPLRDTLYDASVGVGYDNVEIVALADVYLKRRPLDARAWLWSSLFYQRLGNQSEAVKHLAVAHRLSQTNVHVLIRVFNRYLELNLIDQAMPVAHDIIQARPNQFRRLFYLMTRLSDDYARVVEQVIPVKDPSDGGIKKEYAPYYYFSLALKDALRLKNAPLAEAIWSVAPIEFKRNSDDGVKYLRFLASLQNSTLISDVWRDVVGQALSEGVLNSSTGISSPCWEVKDVDGAITSTDFDKYGNAILSIEFDGSKNLRYAHLTCLALVQKDTHYKLKGRWKGDDISTLSGPFIRVVSSGSTLVDSKVKPQIGSWLWSDFDLSFYVPNNISLISIGVQRNRTGLLDSKISGKVWFDQIRLEKVVLENDAIIKKGAQL